MNKQKILNQILMLTESKGMTPSNLASALNLSNSSFTDWNKGKAFPKLETLIKIARYFNVSLDYIVFGENMSANNSLTNKEYLFDSKNIKLMSKFNKLPNQLQAKVISYIDGMIAANEIASIKNGENNSNKEIS